PYELMNEQHLLYDLIYNPAISAFLQKGADRGATIKNGHEMLILQAEASWEIWNEKV
ncbi:MAG: Shikimate dehydrogenase substrate binding domain protein, partial [Bacteroidetes bacterium]|nr:Shikimate dehydrogenase substrate binding domain protein [Bacteroidota bacterium]